MVSNGCSKPVLYFWQRRQRQQMRVFEGVGGGEDEDVSNDDRGWGRVMVEVEVEEKSGDDGGEPEAGGDHNLEKAWVEGKEGRRG
jgi:hypothetical protein